MSTILIDDSNSIFYDMLNDVEFKCGLNETPYTIAERVNGCLNNNEKIKIIINVEGKFGGGNRQEQKGVEILLWLRCKHKIKNPVILFGFQSNQQLLKQKPEHLIINSEGCYYYRLPYNLSSLLDKQFAGAPNDNGHTLRKYLKPAFSLEQFRHRESNWWGVKCLWDVHKIKTEGKFTQDYPDVIKEKLGELNNCVADYCFGIGVERLADYMQKLKNELKKEYYENKEKLTSIINEYVETEELRDLEMQEYNNTIKEINIFNSELEQAIEKYENGLQYLSYYKPNLADVSYDYNKIAAMRNELLKMADYLDNVKISREILVMKENEKANIQIETANITAEMEKYVEHISTFSDVISKENIELKNFDKTVKEKRNFSIKEFINKNVKVLYIDDCAKDGWSEIFQNMIYGSLKTEDFTVIDVGANINKPANIEEKINAIFQQNRKNIDNADVILLDVRLFPDYDELQGLNVELMSGPKLLKKIREEYLGIPIIITTASNKVWTYEKLIALGADAYWVKEGLDEKFSVGDTINNYSAIIKLISKTTKSNYKFLRSLDREVKKLKRNPAPWWRNPTWTNKCTTECDPRDIYAILDQIVISLRLLLNRYMLKDNEFNPNLFSIEACSIIIRIGTLIEALHHSNNVEFNSRTLRNSYKENDKQITGRQDEASYLAYQYRNLAAHSSSCRCDKVEYIIEPLQLILSLLTSPYRCSFQHVQPNESLNINSWIGLSGIYKQFLFNNTQNNTIHIIKY